MAGPGDPVVSGRGDLLRVDRVDTMTDEEIAALFHKVRNPEYQAVVQGCREILAQLDRYRTSHRGSVAALRAKLDGLKRELDRIQSIDYLEAPVGQRARALWETTAKRLRAAETRPRATGGRHRTSLPARGSTWVTRPRPHIDRIASAWLIKRFCDPDAKFAFADAADAARQGHPLRRARRGFWASRRGLHVRDAGQAVRDQGPAGQAHRRNRPRGGPARRQVHRATNRRAWISPSVRSPRPRRTITTCSSAAWPSSTGSTWS